jgi:hypothetical protein
MIITMILIKVFQEIYAIYGIVSVMNLLNFTLLLFLSLSLSLSLCTLAMFCEQLSYCYLSYLQKICGNLLLKYLT